MSAALAQLAAQCAACRACPHGATRTQTVFAKGDPLSTLCFVGEAPGEEEDAQGQPFVGDSGRFLDRQIAAMREYATSIGVEFPASPYVCNVLKCRPPGNKLLKDGSDIAACSPHLWTQLRSLPNLRVIVAVGRVPAQTLLSSEETISKLRGKVYHSWDADAGETLPARRNLIQLAPEGSRFPVCVPTYHPAYLLRRRNDKALHAEAWADLKRAVEGLR